MTPTDSGAAAGNPLWSGRSRSARLPENAAEGEAAARTPTATGLKTGLVFFHGSPMSDRAQLVAVILVVLAFVGGYAVCRRPQSAPQIGSEPQPAEMTTSDSHAAGPWSAKSIADERLRKTVEELLSQYDKLQALAVTLKTTMPDAAGMEGKTDGGATYAMLRSDGKRRTRFRIFNTFTIDQEEGKKLLTGEEIIQTYDGEHLWLHLNQPQNQSITKAFYDPARVFHLGGPDLFASIFKDSDVELVGEEKVAGKKVGEENVGEWDTYVINSKARSGGWSTKYWFDKTTGVQVKLVETNAEGVTQLTMTTVEINTSPQFLADRFDVKMHESFKFIDETK